VRELKNVVERSLYRWPRPEERVEEIVFDPFASPHRPGLPPPAAPPLAPAAAPGFRAQIEAQERLLLGEALTAQHFNQRRAAASLGLTYHQLRHYLRKHRLSARP
jgi:psp operon transcriptional activator